VHRFGRGTIAVTRAARLVLAVAFAMLLAGMAAAAAPVTIYGTDFVLADSAVPPGDAAAWSGQALPDEWRISRPRTSGVAWYRFRIALPETPGEVQALYVPRGGDRLAVFVNGRLVGSTAEEGGEARHTWKRPLLFTVPPAALVAGDNLIHIRLQGRADHQSGLSPIAFGPEGSLRDAYWRRFAFQTVGPVGLAAALGLLGIFFLILWSRRREDSTYVLFGAASLVWAARNVLDVLFHLAIPQPHWEILLAVLYLTFVGLLCLFSLRFVGQALPRYERLLRWSMPASPAVLYASLPWVPVLNSTRFLLLYALALVVPAMLVVAQAALFQRNLGAILIALAGFVAFCFGAYDWIAVGRQGMFDSVRLVPYAAPFFTTAIGWLLAHRFMSAYADLERMNMELDDRVALKSAELLNNLTKLEQAKTEAEEASRAKSRFLAAASHDLRQPLHALGLFAENLGMKDRAPETQDLVRNISQSVEALEKMFAELLDISRLDAGAIKLELRCFAMQEIFDRIAVDFLPLAQEKGLHLRIRATKEWAESDPLMIERVVRNLVSNAIRYTERGGVLVACRRRGKRLWVEVRDSGVGIAESERERIFEEFYQVGNAERDRSKGLGLGLSIVKRLMALLGEKLVVKSAPGRGSVFAVRTRRTIPLAAEDAQAGLRVEFAEGRHLVALIEDDRLVRWATEELLAQHGLAVAAGADFRETRDALNRDGRAPDLIIADCRLRGGQSGVDAARQLRRQFGEQIPVLLLTGESSREGLAEGIDSGFPILKKPVMADRLFARIAKMLPAASA
jgi:signal transduction histidine kinase/CheY-like chemotaxis protein